MKDQPASPATGGGVEEELRILYLAGMRIGARTSRDLAADDLDAALPACLAALEAMLAPRAQLEEAERALAVCRQSLSDQASARADPSMPLLTPEVREALRENAEAAYALAETREERVEAHGLMLLLEWQDRPAALSRNEGAAVTVTGVPSFEIVRRYAVVSDLAGHKNVRSPVSLDDRDRYSTADLAEAQRIAADCRRVGLQNVRLIDACSGETLG